MFVKTEINNFNEMMNFLKCFMSADFINNGGGHNNAPQKGGEAMSAIVWWWLGLILFLYLIF